MRNKKILTMIMAIGLILIPFTAYAADSIVRPTEYQIGTVAETWELADFTISGTTITGLSASGQSKIMKNSVLVLPDKNSNDSYITAIGDGTMRVGTFGYKDLSDNAVYVPTSVVFPSHLESIGKFAFSANFDNNTKEQVGLTSVEFPNTLKTIGMLAFQNAPLTELVIPDSVTSIETGAFTNAGNIKITKLTLSNGLTKIENSAFNSQRIENIVIPEGVKSVGSSAFYANFSKKVSLPSTLTSIDSKAFCNHQFTEVKIPDSVATIGTSAFAVNDRVAQKTLTKVNIPASLTKLDKQVFEGSALESVEIPAGLTSLESTTFVNSTNTVLVKVAVLGQLTTLADGTSHKVVCDINNENLTVTDNLPNVTYTGSAFEPTVTVSNGTVELIRGADYTVEYADNTDAGTASVIVKGVEGSKYCGELTRKFTIAPKVVTPAIELSKKSYIYNGKAQTPAVKITVDGEVVPAENYTIAYNGNTTNAGTYKVTATLKNNYSGTATCSVTIAKAKSAITAKARTRTVKKTTVKKKAVTVISLKVSKAAGKITYKKISGSKRLKVDSRTGKITVTKHKCSKKTKNYKASVKVSCAGTSNYNGSSKIITVTVKMK